MSSVVLEVYLGSVLGEGALWDSRRQVLYWIDIERRYLHMYDPGAGINRTYPLPRMIGAVAPRERGDLLLALEDGFWSFDESSSALERIIDPEAGPEYEGNRFNDGACDPAGRYWAGTMSKKELPGKGSVYRLDPDGSCTKMFDSTTISNGICWDLREKSMYYVDTPTRTVQAFSYDAESGAISGGRTAVTVAEEDGYPDGMTIDAEGMLWAAHWEGWKVIRYDPRTGLKLAEVRLPVSRVTCCSFGGEDLKTLYITTASIGLTEEERRDQPLAGGLFSVRTEVPGLPTDYVKG